MGAIRIERRESRGAVMFGAVSPVLMGVMVAGGLWLGLGHGLIDRVGLECDRSGSGAIDAVRAIALMGALDFLAGLESV
jgi:hypothetical protein